MKKFISALAAAAIALVPFSTANSIAYAEDTTGNIKVETVSSEPGETVDVAIEINNNPGVIGLGLEISYNSEFLSLPDKPADSVTDCKLFSGATFTPNGDTTNIPYYIFWVDGLCEKDYTENGTLAIMHFNVLETAKSGSSYDIEVSVRQDDTYNFDYNDVEFTVENGSINIKETEPTTEPTTEETTTTTVETTTATEENTTTTTETTTEAATTTTAETTTTTEVTITTTAETTTTTEATTTTTAETTITTEETTTTTAETTTATEETTTLPQTGNNVVTDFVIVVSSFILVISGACITIKYGSVLLKK